MMYLVLPGLKQFGDGEGIETGLWENSGRMVGNSEKERLRRRSAITPVKSPSRQLDDKRPLLTCAGLEIDLP